LKSAQNLPDSDPAKEEKLKKANEKLTEEKKEL